jgi:hypothetical protein
MTRSLPKDLIATVLTLVAVLVFIANHEGWGMWLVGDSRRWAAAVITLLGAATCTLGSPDKGSATKWLAMLGVLALVLAGVALATGSLTALSLLVADIVALWALSTTRHVLDVGHKPLTT